MFLSFWSLFILISWLYCIFNMVRGARLILDSPICTTLLLHWFSVRLVPAVFLLIVDVPYDLVSFKSTTFETLPLILVHDLQDGAPFAWFSLSTRPFLPCALILSLSLVVPVCYLPPFLAKLMFFSLIFETGVLSGTNTWRRLAAAAPMPLDLWALLLLLLEFLDFAEDRELWFCFLLAGVGVTSKCYW